ncbi:MAG TPA: response regulator [Stellaceae bacterium]|jgi:DNA-binding response OmpR family regulator|nr:response regulator [Stellaceae bacterium]
MLKLAKTKVLFAEDEPFMRNVLEATLANQGLFPRGFSDGEEALEVLSGGSYFPDLVLLDFVMPRAHGLHVLKQIRMGRTAQPRNLPVGLLTGISDKRTVALSIRLDCNAFIVKPIQKTMLLERMERMLSQRQEPKAHALYDMVDVGDPDGIVELGEPDEELLPYSIDDHKMRLSLSELKPGMQLIEDLCLTSGDVVVPKGVAINEDLLQVLSDLEKIAELRPVAIERRKYGGGD